MFYLAPGDYHWFHSPADIIISKITHIPGVLKKVDPMSVEKFKNIYNKNEWVVLEGNTKFGKIWMTMIGALNVGSIRLNFLDLDYYKLSNKN